MHHKNSLLRLPPLALTPTLSARHRSHTCVLGRARYQIISYFIGIHHNLSRGEIFEYNIPASSKKSSSPKLCCSATPALGTINVSLNVLKYHYRGIFPICEDNFSKSTGCPLSLSLCHFLPASHTDLTSSNTTRPGMGKSRLFGDQN